MGSESAVLFFRLKDLEHRVEVAANNCNSAEEAALLGMLSFTINHATIPEWLCEDLEGKMTEFEALKKQVRK
jgi:hypothetical protein